MRGQRLATMGNRRGTPIHFCVECDLGELPGTPGSGNLRGTAARSGQTLAPSHAETKWIEVRELLGNRPDGRDRPDGRLDRVDTEMVGESGPAEYDGPRSRRTDVEVE